MTYENSIWLLQNECFLHTHTHTHTHTPPHSKPFHLRLPQTRHCSLSHPLLLVQPNIHLSICYVPGPVPKHNGMVHVGKRVYVYSGMPNSNNTGERTLNLALPITGYGGASLGKVRLGFNLTEWVGTSQKRKEKKNILDRQRSISKRNRDSKQGGMVRKVHAVQYWLK